LRLAALAAVVAIGGVIALRQGPVMAVVGFALAAWLIAATAIELADRIRLFRIPLGQSLGRLAGLPRAAIGMAVAHGALGIVVLGITASAAWRAERILIMAPGDTVAIAGYRVTLDNVAPSPGPNYTALRATMTVRDSDGGFVTRLYPEKRNFITPPQSTTEAAIHTTLLADLYAVIGDPGAKTAADARADAPGSPPAQGQSGWTVRIYHNPLVPWIWIGAVIMVFGGLISLSDRRLRIGAPRRSRQAVDDASGAPGANIQGASGTKIQGASGTGGAE
jgi:cytochrome c-type biogenesis protein CcmF